MFKDIAKLLFILLLAIQFNIYGQNDHLINFQTTVHDYFEKATILPNKHIFSILPCANQYPLILQAPSALLEQNHTRSLRWGLSLVDAFYFNYEYSFKHNFFAESGFKYLTYFTGYTTNSWLVQSGIRGRSTNAFSTYSFDFGGGYRVKVNNNVRLFDIHLGISAAFTDNKVGTGGVSYINEPYQDGMGNIGTLEILSYYEITKRFNLGYYLGISKDIRVTDNLYLTARFNNHFGKSSIISEHTINYSLSTLDIVNSVPAKLTAKGKMYALGLRWVF